MHRLSSIIFLGLAANLFAQSPHGEDLKINCAACHSPAGWEIGADFWKNSEPQKPGAEPRFDHSTTRFELNGQHEKTDCRTCHETLVFAKAASDCISCHTDFHQQTVGRDCARCHDSDNWLVDNITELHIENGFPLFGQHRVADCNACHFSESGLRFDRIGNDCINCHLENYMATTSPDHRAAGYSTDCVMCHDVAAPDWLWSAGAANHLFFPLTGGHEINDCSRCHVNGVFQGTPTDCFACHEKDFQATTSPDHETGNFPTDCKICHTTDPGWNAGNFTQHDQLYFPIFSGKHEGAWNQCSECHTTAGDFKAFSCTDCHEHNNANDLADEHNDVSGYSFSSAACYSCHPKGN